MGTTLEQSEVEAEAQVSPVLQASKLDATTLRVTKSEQRSFNFTRAYLVGQRAKVVAQRDAELAEIDELLAQCDALGIMDEAEDPIDEELEIPAP